MKSYFLLCFVLAFLMFVSPLASLDYSKFSKDNVKTALSFLHTEEGDGLSLFESRDEAEENAKVKVLEASSGKILKMEDLEYVVGCIAGEMSPTYHEEALKAQAVAAYTNLKRQQLAKAEGKQTEEYDITNDTGKHQAYLTKEERQKTWGNNFSIYEEKITKAAQSVAGQTLTYKDKPIVASFFSLSPGRSENVKEIWGGNLPYLVSVVCPGDSLAPNLVTEQKFSPEEVRKLLEADSEIQLSDNPAEWLQDIAYSDSGSGAVSELTVGGKRLRGNAFRALLDLKSPAFSVEFTEGIFHFTVRGNGHLCGMSQYSADYMARQGSNYQEILKNFYPEATLS